ncbi:hypothetical protein [Olivibacter domesticus]|uniref:Uncharacterized protein n=1 Tax=Olivibacter domesticus TaxID=407022 RepID=A0A1H7IG48_OLID1|nr:hypothetical protein [Olivibacter domesticus]SEK60822.1 hypothetical protein SAMN05661044_00673 [Olivibacter domesticus]
MKIELKNIQHTEEPYPGQHLLPQRGDLYINNIHVGDFISTGIGRPSLYYAKDEDASILIEEAEKYFNRQLEVFHPSLPIGNRGLYVQPSIGVEIMQQLVKLHRQEMENSILEYWDLVAQKQVDNIVVGNPDGSLVAHALPQPIALLLGHSSLVDTLHYSIHRVIPYMGEGDRIVNDNIPKEMLEWCGLRPHEYLSAVGINEDNTGHRMKIEAKNIQYETLLPEGEILYACHLYIDGIHLAYGSNFVPGRQAFLYPVEKEAIPQLKQADAICKWLPQSVQSPAADQTEGGHLSALCKLMEEQVKEHINQQASVRFVQTNQVDSILFGTNGEPSFSVKLFAPVDVILADPQKWHQLTDVLHNAVLPYMGPGQRVLNTNIPDAIFKKAGLRDAQFTPSTADLNATQIKKRVGMKPR